LLSKVKCPRCGKKRLIQRTPMRYREARCLDCGALFSVKKKKEAA
jgi:DNA-directed RNA polymerase subunit RPC12/RpoP